MRIPAVAMLLAAIGAVSIPRAVLAQPQPINDLRAAIVDGQLQLSWTVPTDVDFIFGALNPPQAYDVRYSTTGDVTTANWNSQANAATPDNPVPNPWASDAPGIG